MIAIATLLWQPNEHSHSFSAVYDARWVEKLYRGVKRNLTQPFEFICYTDRDYMFQEPIKQLRIFGTPSYATCIQPYSLNRRMILMGLDTVITGNIDHLVDATKLIAAVGLPRDPYHPSRACNGVALVPAGRAFIAYGHNGENDMEWMRAQQHFMLDDVWPGQIVSYKGHVKEHGLGDARIVYFHGMEKPHELDEEWIVNNWI
ncbi:MAG: hypothetical protein AMJ72_02660 [Acidithiobacillales bacterium SM1_46]|nr:MAG: hypothetical protein AMJ72_02660 [Acidithiobacillales bacterium SM1_46]